MNKQIPSINKIVEFHNFKRSMQLHEAKIKNAKSTLTTRNPNPIKVNITLNKTAKQPFGNSFSRMIEIEFQNKALLKKLTQKNGKPTTSPQNHPQPWQQSSYMKQITNNRKKYFEQHERRIQNEGLLKRLKSVKPLYEMRKYMSERKMTEKYINSISKFNYKDYKPNKTIIKFDMDVLKEETDFNHSRQKQSSEGDKNLKSNKENAYTGIFQDQSLEISKKSNESRQKQIRKLKKDKPKMFTERNPNLKISSSSQKPSRIHFPSDILQNNSSFFKNSQKGFDSSINPTKMMESSFVINQIPQKEIKINGKSFILKGKETMTNLRLQILELKKDKSIGNEYIHEVEISSSVYKKKFGGRIDVIIENLKFSEKNQAFYIS